jgi:hypothetical protein|tara:strand:- start:92 stop:496 length:405 start_codon:yes stop_codon:yes gene_type:complete
MKRVFIVSILLLLIGCASNAVNTEPPKLIEPTEYVVPTEPKEPGEPKGPTGAAMSVNQVVEAACGQCQFEMTERSGCDLAVRIDGKSYFVDGTNIHEHGDEHADDGFCEVIRSANVKGEIIEGRFKSESFILIK